MHLRSLAVVALAASVAFSGCSSGEPTDPEFERDWVEDFENDLEEDAAEEAEQAELDLLDDEDDVEILDEPEDPSEGSAFVSTKAAWKKKPPVRPKHGPISILQDDSWLGAQGDKATAEARMAEAKAAGAQVVRVMVWWGAVAPGATRTSKPKGFLPTKPTDYDFRAVDAQIEAARTHGLKVLLTLTAGHMPYWASEDPGECERRVRDGKASTCSYRPSPKEYARFVTAVGRHVKDRRYRIWGFTFVHEPNVGRFLADDDSPQDKDRSSAMAAAFRYRRLFFAARKHLRKTAGVKARVFYGDLAHNQKGPGEKLSPASPRWSLLPWSLCLETKWNPELLDDKYKCPAQPRKVYAHGVAFHPYASSPAQALYGVQFLERLVDVATAEKRIIGARGIYLTEGGFPTAKSPSADDPGSAVSEELQALYMQQLEHLLSDDPRVKSVAQYRLVDGGDAAWESGLLRARVRVERKDGSTVEGELLEATGSVVQVQSAAGREVLEWSTIAKLTRTGAGSEKPAYAAYRLGLDVQRVSEKVDLFVHVRGAFVGAVVVQGLFGADWLSIQPLTTDAYGYARLSLPVNGATRWRVIAGAWSSREADGNDEAPDTWDPPGEADDDPLESDGPAELRKGCTATASLGGNPAWFHFTRPGNPCRGSGRKDRHILKELVRLIRSVPKGGRIDGHIYNISVNAVAEALYRAEQDGVEVWISTDGQVAGSHDPSKTRFLDRMKHVTYCKGDDDRACIGTRKGAISHTKLFTFSTATSPDGKPSKDVVWFGTANQTVGSGMKLFNNTVSVYGDATLYGRLRGYLDDLHGQKKLSDYHDPASGRGYLLSSSADVFVTPELDTDLLLDRLQEVTPDAQCEVHVLHMRLRDDRTLTEKLAVPPHLAALLGDGSRLVVPAQLAWMKQQGCTVSVVANTVEPKTLAILEKAGIPVREAHVHDKTVLIHGKFGGEEQYRVYTGSYNQSKGSNYAFDEILARLAPERGGIHPVYDAYLAHFDDARESSTPFK